MSMKGESQMYVEISITDNGTTKSCDGIYIPDISGEYADYICMSLMVKAYEMAYKNNKKEAD